MSIKILILCFLIKEFRVEVDIFLNDSQFNFNYQYYLILKRGCMSLTLNNDNAVSEITTGHALKTANLTKDQQELEGQMAINLIESASIDAVAQPIGNSGQNINIKV